jgi:hypothetical protein
VALEDEARRIADALEGILEILADAAPPLLPQPQPFTVRLISERREGDMDLLTYEATLPTVPPATDVASQVFSVTANGTAQPEQTLDKTATAATFEVPQAASVDLALVYVDDGGNRSAPRTQSFVANDTIAPDAPGEFGEVRLVSERQVPDA